MIHPTLSWWLKRKRRKANIRKGGHSQYGQDLAAHQLLGNDPRGLFIDIGANDGVTLSNSLHFEQVGWEGICVEPHPQIFETLQSRRRCHCVNACISDRDGLVDFIAVSGPCHMLSGMEMFLDDRHLERIDRDIAKHGGEKMRIKIEALRPATLLNRYDYQQVDFISIDTEGSELSILQHLDFNTTPTRCISVENGSRTPAIFQFMRLHGFRLAVCVGCDEIYVRA